MRDTALTVDAAIASSGGPPDNVMAYGTAAAELEHVTRGQFERALADALVGGPC